ncbi:MAG: hypothetical protein HZC41_17370 [Chloroflexi bacterium]|nr:hypothetical protein [Chloroflexota bacterium]
MQFLQNMDIGALLLVSIVLVFLCVVVLLLFFGFQFIGSTVFNLVGLVLTIIGGGPGMWCGCLVLLLACAACVGGVLLYSSCATNPSSMNFCALFAGGG